MASSRTWLALLALTIVSPSLALAQPGGFGGGGGPGGGRGRGGFSFDLDSMFERYSGGKDVINVKEMDPQMKQGFDFMAQRWGLTGDVITRDQLKEGFTKAMAQFRQGGFGTMGAPGGGMGGFTRGVDGGAPPRGAPTMFPSRGDRPDRGDRGPGGGGWQGGGTPGGGGGGGGGFDADAMAEAWFRRLDKDGDGLLKLDELNDPRLENLVAERDKWDTDNNGFIDLSEFKAYFAARMAQRAAEMRGPDASAGSSSQDDEPDRRPVVYRAGKLPKDLPEWFAKIDTNQDGQISLAEWRASGRPIDEFKSMDRSGDN